MFGIIVNKYLKSCYVNNVNYSVYFDVCSLDVRVSNFKVLGRNFFFYFSYMYIVYICICLFV